MRVLVCGGSRFHDAKRLFEVLDVLHAQRPIGALANGGDLTQEKGHRSRPLSNAQRKSNRKKSSVRSRIAHCFFVMKRKFGFTNVRYKGLTKNAHFLFVSCALVNMVMAKKTLMKKRRVTARYTCA